ncbi:LytTR family DNA-binding domain-containing protein [uncultured Thomasclavelia sp.]|uniref:LytR/AlgR family response regulator transcription factor n=1 Tax=uncultured Thomasclavelia sp. TaxID=3025759 RepID=UPI0026274063|nr:LytTR family DNA-binding domain-containing protein [uncultured Thomasclavelia sp.]
MNILIYDDNKEDCKNLINCIDSYFKTKAIKYNVKVCLNTKEVYDNIKEYDILFLDIQLKDDNGIDIGLKLQQIYHECRIIITSNYAKYAIEGYKIHADRYFLKPIQQELFNIEMENIINNYFKKSLGIIDETISPKKIYFHNILYIERLNRKTIIHMIDKTKIFTNNALKYWYELTHDYGFIYTHRAFIVNLEHISAINKNEITLTTDDIIPLSRNYKNSFEIEYTKFIQEIL